MTDVVEMVNGDATLVTSPHLVANPTYDRILSDSQKLIGFNKYKFITIRPHVQFMLGRYFSDSVPTPVEYSRKLLNILIDCLRSLDYSAFFIAGSVDKNKEDIGTHLHIILSCSLKNYDVFKKKILSTITMDHMIGYKKQYALKISKPFNSDVEVMIRYYMGIRVKDKKSELIYTIKGYNGSASNVLSISEYEAHLIAYKMTKERHNIKSNRKQTIVEMKNFSDKFFDAKRQSKVVANYKTVSKDKHVHHFEC